MLQIQVLRPEQPPRMKLIVNTEHRTFNAEHQTVELLHSTTY